MLDAESKIPQLATQAGRAAHQRAMSQVGRVVMKSATGQLVEQQADGAVVILKDLPAATPIEAGTVLKRTRPTALDKAAGSR